MEIEYDDWGRMKYHPDYHPNHGKAWSQSDVQYLKDYYSKIGPEEMSFALGRPITAIQQRASMLGIAQGVTHVKRIQKKTDPPASKISQ